jgi:hypothetical protein
VVSLVDCGLGLREAAVWTSFGCSRAGDQVRMLTLPERNNYPSKEVSRMMNNHFLSVR